MALWKLRHTSCSDTLCAQPPCMQARRVVNATYVNLKHTPGSRGEHAATFSGKLAGFTEHDPSRGPLRHAQLFQDEIVSFNENVCVFKWVLALPIPIEKIVERTLFAQRSRHFWTSPAGFSE